MSGVAMGVRDAGKHNGAGCAGFGATSFSPKGASRSNCAARELERCSEMVAAPAWRIPAGLRDVSHACEYETGVVASKAERV